MNAFEKSLSNEAAGANRAQRFAEIEILIHRRERVRHAELQGASDARDDAADAVDAAAGVPSTPTA